MNMFKPRVLFIESPFLWVHLHARIARVQQYHLILYTIFDPWAKKKLNMRCDIIILSHISVERVKDLYFGHFIFSMGRVQGGMTVNWERSVAHTGSPGSLTR